MYGSRLGVLDMCEIVYFHAQEPDRTDVFHVTLYGLCTVQRLSSQRRLSSL